jgi:hypothetical protein
MSRSHFPVKILFNGMEYCLTVEEGKKLLNQVGRALQATKAKCPTCRCSLFPDEVCSCCAQPALDGEPFI